MPTYYYMLCSIYNLYKHYTIFIYAYKTLYKDSKLTSRPVNIKLTNLNRTLPII